MEAFFRKFNPLFSKKWFTALLLFLGALGIGFIGLVFAVTGQRKDMLISYMKRPLLMFLNLLPPVVLSYFLWFLTNRAVLAYGITAVLCFGLGLGNWYKLQFRNDPLLFEDLLLVKEAGNMLGRYQLFVTPTLVLAVLCILAWGAVMFFCARGRFRGWPRFAIAGAVLLLCLPISRLYTDNKIYNQYTQNFDHSKRWGVVNVYTSKGFIYPFLHSVSDAFEQVPEGYSKEGAQAVLAAYTDKDIPEEKKVDIIGVMLEAFNDFSKYPEIPFVQDPYELFHALEEESVRGNLVTNIFAGGTVASERAFVTGYADLGSFRSPTDSYVWYMKDQGYATTGSHPCYNWFYNRANINPNLGFDSYLFYEDHYGELAGWRIARDKVLFPEMTNLYNIAKEESPDPYFSFSVTYQGHGPYNTGVNDWGEDFIRPGTYSETTENIFNNYMGSVRSTGMALTEFVDGYRDLDRPVVIVIFGDHNPWLGDGNSVYNEMGLDIAADHKEGFMNYYGSRYLIWANDAAKDVLGNDFVGDGPDIAPCFLMNQVFRLCGWEGPAYMQYTSDLMDELPVIHSSGACVTADGEYLAEPEGEAAEKIRQFRQVEYYMRHKGLDR